MANNLTLGINEVHLEHSGDESDDDDDDVVEQSPCGRWEKRRQEVGNMPVWFYNCRSEDSLPVIKLNLILFTLCFFKKELTDFLNLRFE